MASAAPDPREPVGRLARWRRRWRSRKVIVRDHSMEPTFWPGDRLLVDPGAYRTEPVVRDDLVVIADPAQEERRLLKRVVGVAGDHVRVAREGVDRVARPSGDSAPGPEGALEELEVPSGHVFVLSDRQQHTRDSRQFGPIPVTSVVGRVWRRLPSPSSGSGSASGTGRA
ncbi:MAG: signal peptidase I [Thermoplasmata archaeon]|nr:signal peptidase I [Thermoplasmata archaeon]